MAEHPGRGAAYPHSGAASSTANAWQSSSPSSWGQAVRRIRVDPSERQAEDAPTVAALGQLLWKRGGQGPASVVGNLYSAWDGEVHRNNIRARGGVGGFAGAHREVFTMEPPSTGSTCPNIRLLTELERLMFRADRKKVMLEKSPMTCKFHRLGQCRRGTACKFSHELPVDSKSPSQTQTDLQELVPQDRMTAIRSQVLYYLSDENLRSDGFFQGVIASSDGGWVCLETILGCRRMQQLTTNKEDIVAALRLGTEDSLPEELELELRAEQDSEAVRRRCPPPVLEEKFPAVKLPADQTIPSRPPPLLLKNIASGWQPIVEDSDRSSFSFVRRNTWDIDLLMQEFDCLRSSVNWCELRNRKEGHVTRSTAWYVTGNCCCRYVYADVSIEGKKRPEWLDAIEARVFGEGCGLDPKDWPNSVNMNLYEHEEQNVGWHSDDEALFRGCERDCRIISASWGAPRAFEVALKDIHHASGRPSIFTETVHKIMLLPGDLCSMEGLFQKYYSHQLVKGVPLPKAYPNRVRINLTWRYIVNHKSYCPLSKD